ncbi:LLM class flavin-dependent oxidoreductase [Cochleicola gelatinilyticus]|uniref:Luciferase-like domain-containing protein n=1 Tax=Cochleicola gelatinilyticus TaxID=1763537 RepID=A0A167IPX5_9FLAO|nr:LLM class flavin-dependent oxidoreductase [Cochleicola gelatinilyticus]OAB79896.1 hypothetical protein ULVI_03915 [Cochleicola gelatinilyticus]
MNNKISLGLLDFGKRNTEYSSMGKVLDVIDYAIAADKLGFSRFWLAEHHNFSSSEAWSSPQMLLPMLLCETERINIGMAGVLINYYSSYEIATNFKMLENLFPSRVDLGFAAGTPPLKISQLLSQQDFEKKPDTVERKMKEIHDFFYAEDMVAERDKIIIPPYRGRVPEMFLLSSSFNKVDKALSSKLNISKSIFHKKESMNYQKEEVLRYKSEFRNRYGYTPKASVAFTGICAPSEKEAQKLASMSGYKNFHNAILGPASKFQDVLLEHQENFGVDEFIFHDANPLNSERINGLESLSEKLILSNHKKVNHEV